MIWLAIAILGSLGFLQTLRWMQHAEVNLSVAFLVNYAMAGVFYAIGFAGVGPAVDGKVAMLGIASGVLYVCNVYLISAAIRRVGMALLASVMSLSVCVPVFASIAYGDPWRSQVAGLAIALVALPVLATARAGTGETRAQASSARRVILVLVCFFAMGAEGTLLKSARQFGDGSYEWVYLPALFVTAAIVSAGPVLAMSTRKLNRAGLVAGLILGGCNILANYGATQAVRLLDGPVIFPVRQMGIVLGATLIGWLWWREKLSRRAVIGIVLTVLATLALSLPGLLE